MNRKYMHKENKPSEKENNDTPPEKGINENQFFNDADNIESPIDNDEERGKMPHFSLFSKRIFLDEIILLGVIFLLLEEGIEDELILIVLAFILLFGRE
jgi:hypothetical protein